MYLSFTCIFILTAQRRQLLDFIPIAQGQKNMQGNMRCLSMVNKKISSSQMSTLMNAIFFINSLVESATKGLFWE